ncbi:hypothetical protein BK704_10980 [[Bacillus thuringiensis] serovar konkukian]|nr:binary toxin-like calcium binding domain-containing protein [Bacillus thuringiensis]MED1305303.1 RICIN domain-containing protein [Bacillus pacificus]OUB12161.1 hypothetical protein BK704_10980 [[Bacillus thuringiensis] serovar konkukian]
MQLNKMGKCIATSVLLSQLITYSGVSYAESNTKAQQETTVEQVAPSPQGLMGYYYQDPNFQQLVLMGHRQATDLKIPKNEVKALLSNDQQQIQSARWIGYIKPSQTGEYIFSTSSDQHVIIELDGNSILNQSSMTEPIQLEKDKQYKIRIEYAPQQVENKDPLVNLDLNWSISGGKVEQIPAHAFLLPDFSRKQDKEKIIPETSLFQEQGAEDKVDRSKKSLVSLAMSDRDTDDDSIPDSWETDGYTIEGKVAVKWDDSMKGGKQKKYTSNPYNSHTARDPYTDWEKAAGYMDAAIKPEAKNPLVAAYPSVGVHMENLIISNNQNVSSQEGKSISSSTSSSSTSENMVGVDVSAGYSLLGGFNAQVTGRYSHTWSSSSSVENSSSNNWSRDLGINTGQSAYLNANVRYYNTGTAPIYSVKPTTNFVLNGASIVTVKAKENQIGNVLKAGGTYPDKQHAPIALNTLDDFGSQLISINYNQMKQLESGEKLDLQTTQASGLYGVIKANGGLSVDPSQEWDPVKAQIESVSASIIMDTGEETLERRVAAKDYSDPEDLTPETTLGEAISMAFNITEEDGEYYKDMSLRESVTGIVFDENTAKEVKAQLDKMPDQDKKLYNVKIKQGMNIMIQKPVWFDHFDSNDHARWSNDFTIANGEGIKGDAGHVGQGDTLINLNGNDGLKPNTTYLFSVYAKSSKPAKVQAFYGDDGSRYGIRQKGQEITLNEAKGYQRIQVKFATDEKGSIPQYRGLGIKVLEGSDILIDDAMLLELRPTVNEDVLDSVQMGLDARGDIYFNSTAPFREDTDFELFMNGHRKGRIPMPKGGPYGGLTYFPTYFKLSYTDTTNPNNKFEVKVNGKTILGFNGITTNAPIPSGTYQIVTALNNSSVIDINQADGNVQLWTNGNTDNQRWKLRYEPGLSAYTIVSEVRGYPVQLALTWGSYQDSNNVVASYYGPYEEQLWIVEDAGNGLFYLRNKKNPNKVLDVTGTATTNGTNIIVWDFNGGNNQKFKLQQLN